MSQIVPDGASAVNGTLLRACGCSDAGSLGLAHELATSASPTLARQVLALAATPGACCLGALRFRVAAVELAARVLAEEVAA